MRKIFGVIHSKANGLSKKTMQNKSKNRMTTHFLWIGLASSLLFSSCAKDQRPANQIAESRPIPVVAVADVSNEIAKDIVKIKSTAEEISKDVDAARDAAEEAKVIAERIDADGAAANSEISKNLIDKINKTNAELAGAKATVEKLRTESKSAGEKSDELQKKVVELIGAVSETNKELKDLRTNKKIAEDNLIIEQKASGKLKKELAAAEEKAKARLVYVWIVWGGVAICVSLVVLKVLIATQKINPVGPLRWL